MNQRLARAIIAVAMAALGRSQREWALAMRAELDAAIEDGKPLTFALGCLVAAWGEMPRREEGRFLLASYALVLGLIIPMAAMQLACATGLPLLFSGGEAPPGVPAWDSGQQLYLAGAYLVAKPFLLGIWMLLCVLHLRLAWLLLEREWTGVVRACALCAALTATLVIFNGVLLLADARTVGQAAALGVELLAVAAAAQWDAELCARASLADPVAS